jgi:hypothetical protein
VWIDFANLAQTVDSVHPGHTNVHDDCIGALFLQKLEAGLDVFGGVDLVTGLEEHPQALAWSNLIINDENLGGIRGSGNVHCERIRELGPCRFHTENFQAESAAGVGGESNKNAICARSIL